MLKSGRTTCLIGIRREDKNKWEARAPLTPQDVNELSKQGLSFVVQPSKIRVYSEQEYLSAGAEVKEDLSECTVILAIKEIPPNLIQSGKAYLFFSHTSKGQLYNRELFLKFLKAKATLIDFEKITDERGQRLVFFGLQAGFAGAIDTLWAFGQRLAKEGFHNSPLSQIKQTYHYKDLAEVKAHLSKVGKDLYAAGIPKELQPLIIGITGYGRVSKGAQEILEALGVNRISPEDLFNGGLDNSKIQLVIFQEQHLVRSKASEKFALQDYYQHPEKYEPALQPYLKHLTVLINGIYWEPKYPRFVTRAGLAKMQQEAGKLRVIGDISCDVEGSIEINIKVTDPDQPCYTYHPSSNHFTEGIDREGIVVLAVDNLPCEIPRDASEHFGNSLKELVLSLRNVDLEAAFEYSHLPEELARATLVYKGEIRPAYLYLKDLYQI